MAEGPAEVLPVVGPLELALGPRPYVDPPVVEELDLHRRRIQRGAADGKPSDGPGRAGVETGHRGRDQLDVVAVHAGPVDAGHHGPLHDPGGPRHVAATHHRRSLGQHAGVRGGQAEGRLGREVHVEQARDPAVPEQPAGSPRLPDDRLGDDGTGIDRLVGVDLDLRVQDCAFADVAFVGHHDALLHPGSELDVRVLADDAASKRGGRPHVHVVVNDASVKERTVPNDVSPAQDGVGPEDDPSLDPGVLPDVGGTLHLRVRVDLSPLAQPHPVADLETFHLHLYLAVQDVAVDLHVGVEGADVRPVPVADVAVDREALLQEQGEEVPGEVELAPLGDEIKDLTLDDVDPRVGGVAEHVSPPRLLQEPLHPAFLVRDDDPELQRVLDALQRDRDRRASRLVDSHQLGEVDVREGVPGQHDEPVVQERPRVPDAPRGPQRLFLGGVGEGHAEIRPVAEVVPNDACQEMDRGHQLGEPVMPSEPDDVLHHRLAHDREHRFGLVARERAEARSLAARHHHGPHAGE